MSSKDPSAVSTAVETAEAQHFQKLPTLLRVGLAIVTIIVLMLWILGTFRRGVIQAAKQPVPRESVVGLATEKIEMQTIPAVTEAVGTVQAEKLAVLTARVVANVVEMRVAAGQRVVTGDVLVVLDDRDLRHRVEQAQDAVRGADATVAQAQSDYKRDKPLFDQQVITPYDFEHTQTNLKTAEANLHRLQQAESEAEVNLSYAVIRSPFSGVVIDKLANVGDLAAPGKPLFTMYEQGRFWLEANVPEDLLAGIHIGQARTVRIDARHRELGGQVVEIVPSSDPATRTVVVRVHLEDTREIVPGMFGRLLIPSAPERVLTVPAAAISRAGQLTMVDVVDHDCLERRTVQLGRTIGNRVEILSGIAAGDTVVLKNLEPSARGNQAL